MKDYSTNCIELMEGDSVKVVLGSVISKKPAARLSAGITRVDQILLMALQEEYSSPALLEFFGRYILSLTTRARGLRPSKSQLEALELSDKMGYALLGTSRALEAMVDQSDGDDAADEPDKAKAEGHTRASAEEFIRYAKEVQKHLNRREK